MTTVRRQVAIVTGGASGIGRALCHALARRGAIVIVADINVEGAQGVAAAIRGRGEQAAAHEVDVADAGSVNQLVQQTVAAQRRLGFSRTLVETTSMSASIDAYVATAPRMAIGYLFAAAAVLLAVSIRTSGIRRAFPLFGFTLTALGLSFWLSLGPSPTWAGHTYPGLGIYQWLQGALPGMDAIRVASRFAVVFLLFLTVLAGMGASLIARLPRFGVVLVLL